MPEPRRFAIIYNPTAGGQRTVKAARDAAATLEGLNCTADLYRTREKRHAEQIVMDTVASDPSTCVVACGGDGTVQEVVNGVVRTGLPETSIGILPAGRCNDFARALGIPRGVDEAARLLVTASARGVDLARVNGRCFCTVGAIGFDAVVSRYVNDHRLPIRGTSAYVLATLASLWRYQPPELEITGDFGAHRGPVFLVATANTSSYGGAMRIAPEANPFDGLLNICLVTRISRRRVLRLLPRVMAGRHTDLPEVRMMVTRTLTIRSLTTDGNWEIWADGEAVGCLPVTIEAVPQGARFLLPS